MALTSVMGLITALSLPFPFASLVYSILIRLIAASIAFYMVVRFREKRVLLVGFTFVLMALRQVLTIFVVRMNTVTTTSHLMLSELPGFAVSVFGLGAVLYLNQLLNRHTDIVKKQADEMQKMISLLPICACCKKIRVNDDDPYDPNSWKPMEEFFSDNSGVTFSHGICPECSKKFYQESRELLAKRG